MCYRASFAQRRCVGKAGFRGEVEMARRKLAGTLTILAFLAAPAVAAAQGGAPPTPWGHPDLQGVWDFRTITPM